MAAVLLLRMLLGMLVLVCLCEVLPVVVCVVWWWVGGWVCFWHGAGEIAGAAGRLAARPPRPSLLSIPFPPIHPSPPSLLRLPRSREEETNQTVIEGMGELHLEIIVDRLRREWKVECDVGAPQV